MNLSATEGILRVLRRWLAAATLLLGLGLAGLAVCSATVWRPPDQVTASLTIDSEAQVLVTAPGVLEAQADSVAVSVKAKVPVVVAVGRETDVMAWIGDSPGQRITGFTSTEVFSVTETGSTEPISAAAGSDLWLVSREFTGEGTLRWDRRPEGRWSLVVAPAEQPVAEDDGETTRTVTLDGTVVSMTWPRHVVTPWLWPGLIVGAVLAAGGLAWLAAQLVGPRRARLSGRSRPVATPEQETAGTVEEPEDAPSRDSHTRGRPEPRRRAPDEVPALLGPARGESRRPDKASELGSEVTPLETSPSVGGRDKPVTVGPVSARSGQASLASQSGTSPPGQASSGPAGQTAGGPAGQSGASLASLASQSGPSLASLASQASQSGASPASPTGTSQADDSPDAAGSPSSDQPDDQPAEADGVQARQARPGRRGWFRRRFRPEPVDTVAPVPPVTPEPPKLDLGLATPNRNWERLAAPQLHYPSGTGEISPMDVAPGFETSVPGAGFDPVLFGGGRTLASGSATNPSNAGTTPDSETWDWSSRPAGSPGRTPYSQATGANPVPDGASSSGSVPVGQAGLPGPYSGPPPTPSQTSAGAAGFSGTSHNLSGGYTGPYSGPTGPDRGTAPRPAGIGHRIPRAARPAAPLTGRTGAVTPPLSGAPASMWASGQLPVQGGGEVGQTGQAGAAAQSPPASPADKIAALRESHTSMADDAAATIAAAMAAAGGAGSAAGLTRRQIREAERAAADALRAQADRTGEIPPWDSFGGPGLIPPVEMQVREEPGR